MRRLIVNADDFGSSREANEAVILAHRHGILTSASLMVSGEAFDHAVALAKENPGLAVGLHVTCAYGRPVMHPLEIPHLVGKTGTFSSDPALAGLRYLFSRSARRELFREISAQFEKFRRSGLNFSHVDGHCHLHVHPVVLNALVEICQSYGIKRMRIPADSFFAALPFLPSPVMSAGYAVVFKLLTGTMKRSLRKRGFIFPQRVYGNMMTGRMSTDYVLSLLDGLPQGTSEIYFHPALSGSLPISPVRALMAGGGPAAWQPFREFSILIDPEVRSKIDRLGIILSTYFDLEKDL